MRKEDITENLEKAVFDFFYWFSRFEFSLKENGFYIKEYNHAAPDWNAFIRKYVDNFEHTSNTCRLLELNPKQQVVRAGNLDWEVLNLGDKSELNKTILLLKTIRNNLFHGGKHGADGWDDPVRTEELLLVGKAVLDELAILGAFDGDYDCHY